MQKYLELQLTLKRQCREILYLFLGSKTLPGAHMNFELCNRIYCIHENKQAREIVLKKQKYRGRKSRDTVPLKGAAGRL